MRMPAKMKKEAVPFLPSVELTNRIVLMNVIGALESSIKDDKRLLRRLRRELKSLQKKRAAERKVKTA